MPKMKAYATFALYLADQSPRNRGIVRALRAFVKRTAPELVEAVKWGNGCWLQGAHPIAYVYCDADHVQFGFVAGASLADPQHLLEGKGQYVRHVKVRSAAEIDERALGALLREAVRLGSPRAKATQASTKAPASRRTRPAKRSRTTR